MISMLEGTRCNSRPAVGIRCSNKATGWLFTPKGKAAYGGYMCRECAERITAEYHAKLNEEWVFKTGRRTTSPNTGNVTLVFDDNSWSGNTSYD